MSALWPVQVAMVAALGADSALAALVGERIYDGQAPQGAEKPYIVVGDHTEAPQNVLGGQGWSDTITLHVFSAYAGTKEALNIVGACDAALAAPVSIAGHGAARLRPEFGTVLVEEDGVRHAPRRYRVTTFAT